MYTQEELTQRLGIARRERDVARVALGRALLDGETGKACRKALADAEREIGDVEAMLAAAAAETAQARDASRFQRQVLATNVKAPLAEYQAAVRRFANDYMGLKGSPELMNRATALYELAKKTGNVALSDVADRFKNYPGSPELLSFTDERLSNQSAR